MHVETLRRVFKYNGASLQDPDSGMTPEQVKDIYSAAYPELTTAVIEGPEESNGQLAYSFRKAVGTKQ
jgi:PRTRC genetic system protein C